MTIKDRARELIDTGHALLSAYLEAREEGDAIVRDAEARIAEAKAVYDAVTAAQAQRKADASAKTRAAMDALTAHDNSSHMNFSQFVRPTAGGRTNL